VAGGRRTDQPDLVGDARERCRAGAALPGVFAGEAVVEGVELFVRVVMDREGATGAGAVAFEGDFRAEGGLEAVLKAIFGGMARRSRGGTGAARLGPAADGVFGLAHGETAGGDAL